MSRGLSVFVNIGGKLLPSLNASAAGVERRMGTMVRRFKLGTAEMKAEWRAFAKSIKPIAGLAAAGGLSMGFTKTIGAGGNFMHEVAALRLAGRTAGETAKAIKQAQKTASEVPTSTLTENLKILRETTGAYGDMGHAMENLSFNQRMGYMMTNVMGMDREESMSKLVAGIQALEIRGSAMDHTRYQREMNSLFQASAFFAGKEGAFTPESLRAFAKTGALPLKSFDERFLTRILPAMITEVGSGDIVGTQASAFRNQIMGRVPLGGKKLTEEWIRLGLVPPNGTGGNLSRTGWTAGTVKGHDLAMRDPLAWVEKVMLPAMAAKGINTNDPNAVLLQVSKMFGRETAMRFVATLADPRQRNRLHMDEANINKAMSSETGYKFMLANDPQAAWAKVMSKLDNLATILGEKVFTDKTIAAIDRFATGIDKLGQFFDKHPTLAKGAVGGMGLGAVGGMMAMFGGGRFLGFILKGLLSGGGKVIWGILGRLGPLLFRGFMALAPFLVEGLVGAFALLSNPIGWAVILAGVAGALVWYFWDDLKGLWFNTIVPGWNKLWTGLKDWVMSIDWGSIGMRIADFLTFGLASKFKGAVDNFRTGLANSAPSPAVKAGNVGMDARGSGMAGMRANGGPIRAGLPYLVGERGPEVVWPGRNSYVSPNHHVRAMARGGRGGRGAPISVHGATIVINDTRDPEANVRAFDAHLRRMANGQAALLSD